jgi:hypothetical protein
VSERGTGIDVAAFDGAREHFAQLVRTVPALLTVGVRAGPQAAVGHPVALRAREHDDGSSRAAARIRVTVSDPALSGSVRSSRMASKPSASRSIPASSEPVIVYVERAVAHVERALANAASA